MSQYVKDLEATVAKFLQPLNDIPFPIVMKSLYGFRVLPFDKGNAADTALLARLAGAVKAAAETANAKGIEAKRANEVGNYIEPFVKNALNGAGMQADTPVNSEGKRQATGYPDIEVKDCGGTTFYLECKTYSRAQLNTSFRSFYFQPSATPKVTQDALHLLVSFEIEEEWRGGGKVFVPVRWKIYTLDKLRVGVKHEFNASNKEMYDPESLLEEGVV